MTTVYEDLQRRYCSNSSNGPKAGENVSRMGKRAVRNAHEAAQFLSGPVLAIGCGDGTEILAIQETGIDDVIGIEVVRERVEKGKSSGLDIRQGRIDQLLNVSLKLHGRHFDIHASHVLEHCDNLDKAVFNIVQLMGFGNRVAIYTPIEPNGSGNQVHFSPIPDLGYLFNKFSSFEGMNAGYTFRVLFMEYRVDLELEGVLILEKIPFKKG